MGGYLRSLVQFISTVADFFLLDVANESQAPV